MFSNLARVAGVAMVMAVSWQSANGQMAASRLGIEKYSAEVGALPVLTREVAESFITLDGRARRCASHPPRFGSCWRSPAKAKRHSYVSRRSREVWRA